MRMTLLALSLALRASPARSAHRSRTPPTWRGPKCAPRPNGSPPKCWPGAAISTSTGTRNREVRTAKLVADHLRALGLDVKTGIATTGWSRCSRGQARPAHRHPRRPGRAAVTERHALPFASKVTSTFRGETVGVMHACGPRRPHRDPDGRGRSDGAMKADLPGEVLFVFSRPRKARRTARRRRRGNAEAGHLPRLQARSVFGLHVFSTLNAGLIGYRAGRHGRVGPLQHRDQGPADARFAAVGRRGPDRRRGRCHRTAQTIVSRRQNISKQPVVVTFGAIKGGIRYNIIPDRWNDRHHPHLRRRHAPRCSRICRTSPNTSPPRTSDRGGADSGHQGQPGDRQRSGTDRQAAAQPGTRGRQGESGRSGPEHGRRGFSFYAREVPGSSLRRRHAEGTGRRQAPSNHSPEFFLDESALDVSLRAMLQVTLDYLHAER